MKPLTLSALLAASLLVLGGCLGGGSETTDDSSNESSPQGNEATAGGTTSGGAELPDDPFFQTFAYPGATTDDVLTMGNATSAWQFTNDEMKAVTDHYTKKFEGGSNHVEAERAYFMLQDPRGRGQGVTVTKQPDGRVQIILKLEQAK